MIEITYLLTAVAVTVVLAPVAAAAVAVVVAVVFLVLVLAVALLLLSPLLQFLRFLTLLLPSLWLFKMLLLFIRATDQGTAEKCKGQNVETCVEKYPLTTSFSNY